MFQIKICGITSVEDALAAARAGADAIGLNFYARSPRSITRDTAREIVASLPSGIVKVGLFVNSPADEIFRRFDELRLDLIQLHGDEPPEFVAQLGGRPVMRAFRGSGRIGTAHHESTPMVGNANPTIDPIIEYLRQCRALAAPLRLVLLDASVAGEYGGTGMTADWSLARDYLAITGAPPLVLAGGLTPENVGAAIRAVRPAAVDVASGVECQPGQKDPVAVAAFVQAARKAFA